MSKETVFKMWYRSDHVDTNGVVQYAYNWIWTLTPTELIKEWNAKAIVEGEGRVYGLCSLNVA